jgi:hypothetical protein
VFALPTMGQTRHGCSQYFDKHPGWDRHARTHGSLGSGEHAYKCRVGKRIERDRVRQTEASSQSERKPCGLCVMLRLFARVRRNYLAEQTPLLATRRGNRRDQTPRRASLRISCVEESAHLAPYFTRAPRILQVAPRAPSGSPGEPMNL